MTTIPPFERVRGIAKPLTPLWERRYAKLRREGFDHEEAARLALRRIGTPGMLKGRRQRQKWFEGLVAKGFTPARIEEAIEEMYDKYDWTDPYTQFYPEEGEEFDTGWSPKGK